MTGKELIIYILQNDLETVELIKNGKLSFMDENQAAVKFGVGVASIKAMVKMGAMAGFELGDTTFLLIPNPAVHPDDYLNE